MTDLAKLTIALSADNARLQRDLDKAQSQVNKFKANASASAVAAGAKIGAALGVGIAAGIVGLGVLVKRSIDAADQLSLLAQKTGLSTEALSQLDFAAKQSGIEDMGDSLVKFNKSIAEATGNIGDQSRAFKELGISQEDLKRSNPEELFTRVAEALSKYADGANKTAIAQKLFGKTGADLIPLLNEGAAGIARFREQADKLGLTISGETAQAANDFNDSIDTLKASFTGIGRQIVTDLTPKLQNFAKFISDPQTIDNLSKFGEAIVISLGAAVTTVTALTSGVTRLYDLLTAAPPTELVDVLDELARVEKELEVRKNGSFLDQFNQSAETVDELTASLAALIKKRDELFAKQRADLQKPPAAEAPKPPAPVDTSALQKAAEEAAKKAAEMRKKIAEATAQAETTIFNAGLDRRQSALEAALDQQKVTQEQYFRALEAIQKEAIDQEIKQRQDELSTADPAERIKLLAEIEAFQTKRLQVSEDTDAKIAASNKKLTDALQADIAAYNAQLETLGKTYQRALDQFGKGPAQQRYDAGRNSIDDQVSQQRTGLEAQRRSGDITQGQFDDSLKALEDFHGKAIDQWNTYYDLIEERSRDFGLGFQEAFAQYADAVKNVGESLGNDLTGALDSAISQTAELAANTILWGEGGTEALKALGRSIITDLVSSLIKAGLQMAVNFAMQQAFGAAATAATLTEATAAATAWTPAAIAASIATLGYADIVGAAGYAAAQASGQALTGAGFAEGGYTGSMGRDQIAGYVHGQEGVVNTNALAAAAEAINDPSFWSVSRNANAAMANGTGGVQVNIVAQPGTVVVRQNDGTLLARLAPELLEMVDIDQERRTSTGLGRNFRATASKLGAQPSAGR